jgi:coenzyme F420-reducing hydrogenase alpha subunit
MTHRSDRTLVAAGLARVEGEGAMYVRVADGQVEEVRLDIYEPPRFFEAFLVGRSYTEPPDITARICGICPVAYQTSACQAIEAACGVRLDGTLADLRRLLYCGEWIGSHALHIYMLHAHAVEAADLGTGGDKPGRRSHRNDPMAPVRLAGSVID